MMQAGAGGLDMNQLGAMSQMATFKTRVQSGGRISIPDAEREALDIEEISEPIGTPDLEINIAATNAGLQIEFVSTADNQRRRVTQTWKEMYAE